MVEFQSAALIVNAQSRKGQAMFEQACAALADLPCPVDAHAVTDPAQLDATLDRALAKRPDLVVLGGGDGTISGLVGRLIGRDVVLGVLPLGTANSFARTLGLPLDVPGAVEVLRTGAPKRIDLGRIEDHYFANCAAIGISPQIAETVPHGLKKVGGRLGYLAWAAWQFVRFRPFMLTIDAGNGPQTMRAVEVRISNGPYHGGTWLVDEADIQSGEIVVQAVRGRYKSTLLHNWATSIVGAQARHQDTTAWSGKAIRIETRPPLPISIDGEVLAKTPVTATVAAGVVRVMAPVED